MKILITIAILFVLLSFGCVSVGEKYRTYRLEGVPLERETESFLFFWLSQTDNDGQELKVPNNINNAGKLKIFDFSIYEKGSLEDTPFAGSEREIYVEPYTLWMNFNTGDAQKIIVNKLFFRTKSREIDLREIAVVSYRLEGFHSHMDFSEEEIVDFRNSGTIDIYNFNNERRIIENIQFEYDDVDVIFKKDKFFIIECDITLVSGGVENYETENYSFTAKFNRIKYTDEKASLLTFLFFYLFSLFDED